MIFFNDRNKNFKREGTSQTFGQSVLITNMVEAEIASSHISDEKFIEPLVASTVVVTIKQIPTNEITNLDEIKMQVAIAAASNDLNTDVIIGSVDKQQTSDAFAYIKNSSLKTREQVKAVLLESQKVDMMISMKSKESTPIEFNNLKIPSLNIKFFYQNFTEDENDVPSQEDPARDPLLSLNIKDIPRFAEVVWDRSIITDAQTGVTIDKTKEAKFVKQNSIDEQSLFGSISNKKTFVNSIGLVVDTYNENPINLLLLKSLK